MGGSTIGSRPTGGAIIIGATGPASGGRGIGPTTGSSGRPSTLRVRHHRRTGIRGVGRTTRTLYNCLGSILTTLKMATGPGVIGLQARRLVISLRTSGSKQIVNFRKQQVGTLRRLKATFLDCRNISSPKLVLSASGCHRGQRRSLRGLTTHYIARMVTANRTIFLSPVPTHRHGCLRRILRSGPQIGACSRNHSPCHDIIMTPGGWLVSGRALGGWGDSIG